MLERTLESPLYCKEIQQLHPKGDQSRVFIGRTDAEAETPILWPPHVKSWLIGKDPDAESDLGQEKGTTKDEMVGWHHQLDGHEFVWTLGVGDGQGSLACCNSWVTKCWTWLSDWTEMKMNCVLIFYLFSDFWSSLFLLLLQRAIISTQIHIQVHTTLSPHTHWYTFI